MRSARLTPLATTSSNTSPGPATGSGTSDHAMTSGPPNSRNVIAYMRVTVGARKRSHTASWACSSRVPVRQFRARADAVRQRSSLVAHGATGHPFAHVLGPLAAAAPRAAHAAPRAATRRRRGPVRAGRGGPPRGAPAGADAVPDAVDRRPARRARPQHDAVALEQAGRSDRTAVVAPVPRPGRRARRRRPGARVHGLRDHPRGRDRLLARPAPPA